MHSFFRDDRAAGVVEYALILGLVAVAVIIALVFFRVQLMGLVNTIGNTLSPAGGGACIGSTQYGQCR